jgi:hypothetical protein
MVYGVVYVRGKLAARPITGQPPVSISQWYERPSFQTHSTHSRKPSRLGINERGVKHVRMYKHAHMHEMDLEELLGQKFFFPILF